LYAAPSKDANQDSDSENNKMMPSLSPTLPLADIVFDDSDVDLNKDRYVLANIRRDRVQSWAYKMDPRQDSEEDECYLQS
jgi:hypothetical protein